MGDYYVTGRGFNAYGPYTLDEAREAAAALANYHDGEYSIRITQVVETPYSVHYDDELPDDVDFGLDWEPWD